MLIGAQRVWVHFRRNKFAKEFAPAVSLEPISVGKKEWRIGNRSHNSPSSLKISPPRRSPALRRHKLRPLRRRLHLLPDRHLPRLRREVVCRGTSATAKDFFLPLLKPCRWS